MTVTINVNDLTLCHKNSDGVSSATLPDVCKTPTPGGPVPLPYPNVARSRDLVKGTKTVLADGRSSCATHGSEFSRSTGDEPGTVGGVASDTYAKEASWISFSFDVRIEGKGACRLTDKMFHNHRNTVNAAGLVQPPLRAEDQEMVDCILELCTKDGDIVRKAKQHGVLARNVKISDVYKYEGGTWSMKKKQSFGSLKEGVIELARGLPCHVLKDTFYHEVWHTEQPESMAAPEKEMQAFAKTEEWTIKRGLPGNPQFRRRDARGKTVVNMAAIRNHVQSSYGANIPSSGALPPQVMGKSEDGQMVRLTDGTTRPVQEGDSFKRDPPQDLDKQRIPPEQLECPPAGRTANRRGP